MKKEIYKGIEYHFPDNFENVEAYLESVEAPEMSDESALEMQWNNIRIKRDRLISLTDYTQVNDSPLSPEKVGEYKVYRQALRDITADFDNPDDVIWPTQPT